MASNPDTLPGDFFKGKGNPDTLPGDFKGGKLVSIDRKPSKRDRHSLTGSETPRRSAGEQALDLAEGTAKVAGIGTLPVATVLAPEATLLGLAGGAAAGYGGKKLAEKAGAGPLTSRAIGDAAGVAGGTAAAEFGPPAAGFVADAIPRVGNFAKAVGAKLPGVQKGKGVFLAARDAYNKPTTRSIAKAKAASLQRQAPWRDHPESQGEELDASPISGELPSGRNVGPAPPPRPGPGPLPRRLPNWHMVRDPKISAPPSTDAIPGELPSGRSAGPAPARPAPSPPPKRVPAWAGIPDAQKATPGATGSIAGELPSGRKTGGPLAPPGGVDPKINEAASGMAAIMKRHGITREDAAKMTPTEWQLVASNAGLKSMPSPETMQAAVAKLEGGKPLRVRRTQAGR